MRTLFRPVMAVACLLVALTWSAMAQTTVNGSITTTTWTKASSPYHVTGTITVPAGNTLAIEPGVNVLMDTRARFLVEGSIRAVGTVSNTIRFIGRDKAAWGGLRISGGDSSTIHYALISDGHAEGMAPYDRGGGIYVSDGHRLGLAHTVISGNKADNYGSGLFIGENASVTLEACTLTRNEVRSARTVIEERGIAGGGGLYVGRSRVTLNNCTITGNAAHAAEILVPSLGRTRKGTSGGGGLLIDWNATVTMNNCTVAQNEGSVGAGLVIYGSTATLHGCNVSGNGAGDAPVPFEVFASGAGGGLWISRSTVLLRECSITGNAAARYGGGLVVGWFEDEHATARLENCSISKNVTNLKGGGLLIYGSTATLQSCTVDGNRTGRDPDGGPCTGGGLYVDHKADVALNNCTITRNEADLGGGLCVDHKADVALNSCTITRNEADLGGGVHVSSSTVMLRACTVADNEAHGPNPKGGGLWVVTSSEVSVVNTIVWGNGPRGIGRPFFGRFFGRTTATYCDIQGGRPGEGNIDMDPLFVNPDRGDYHLQPNSPCIDRGDPASPFDPDGTRANIGRILP